MTSPLNLGRTPARWLDQDISHRHTSSSTFKRKDSPLRRNDEGSSVFQQKSRMENPGKIGLTSKMFESNAASLMNSSPANPFPLEGTLGAYNQTTPSKSAMLGASSQSHTFFSGDRAILFDSLTKVINRRMVLFIFLTFFLDLLIISWPMAAINPGELPHFVLARLIFSFLVFRLLTSRIDFSSDIIQVFHSLFSIWDIEQVFLIVSVVLSLLQQSALFNLFVALSDHSPETIALVNSASVRLAILISKVLISLSFLSAVVYNPRLRRYREMGLNDQSLWKETFLWSFKSKHILHALMQSTLLTVMVVFGTVVLLLGVADYSLELRMTAISAVLKPLVFSCLVLYSFGTIHLYVMFGLIAKIPKEQLDQSYHGTPICFNIFTKREKKRPTNSTLDAYVQFQCLSYISLNSDRLTNSSFFINKDKTTLSASELWREFIAHSVDLMDEFQRQLTETYHLSQSGKVPIHRYDELETFYDRISRRFLRNGIERQMFLASFKNVFFLKEEVKIIIKVFSYARNTERLKHLDCGNSLQLILQKIDGVLFKLEEFKERRQRGFTSFPDELSCYDEAFEELKLCRMQLSLTKTEKIL